MAVSVTVAFPPLAGPVLKLTAAVVVPLGATDPDGELTEQEPTTTLVQLAASVYAAAVFPVFLIVKPGKLVLTFCCVHSVIGLAVTDGAAECVGDTFRVPVAIPWVVSSKECRTSVPLPLGPVVYPTVTVVLRWPVYALKTSDEGGLHVATYPAHVLLRSYVCPFVPVIVKDRE